jgi:hypothetical protein
MARFYEKITESSMQWYDGLSDRERRLISILAATVVALLLMLTIYLGVSKLSSRRAELVRNKQQLAQIVDLEDEYFKAKEKTEKARMTVRRNDVSLFTFIQAVTSRLGVAVKDLNEQKRPLPKSDIVEVSVKLNLSKLSIDKVTALIEAIETSEMGQLIKVTKLKINKRFDEPDLLDLQMTVSTWKTA